MKYWIKARMKKKSMKRISQNWMMENRTSREVIHLARVSRDSRNVPLGRNFQVTSIDQPLESCLDGYYTTIQTIDI
jgi:hypothetical protein